MKEFEAFEDWMASVDFWCLREAGLSVHDLPDCCFHDWYDAGLKPHNAAKRALKAANE